MELQKFSKAMKNLSKQYPTQTVKSMRMTDDKLIIRLSDGKLITLSQDGTILEIKE